MKQFFSARRQINYFSLIIAVSCFFLSASVLEGQNLACQFNIENLQFSGTAVEQARCLLRPNKPRGILGEKLRKMPKPLEKIVGEKVEIRKEQLRKYLQAKGLEEKKLGGDLAESLSLAKLPSGEVIQALYFVIHDTSTPNYGNEEFPSDINERTWKYNNLEMWLRNPVAHVFVNRLGESITTTPFNETVRKGWGTKFARDFLKAEGKGLQIHIELCQPRRTNPEWLPGNDEFAPEVGFTESQYERLALLYVCASIRRGSWLIPAFHSAVDAGIKDAHDDPQRFELEKFAAQLKKLVAILSFKN